MLNPRILITDFELSRAEELVPVLETCVAAGGRNLFLIAPAIKDSAVGLLVTNRERGVLEQAIAVRAPSIGDQRMRILEDLAVITGGRFISQLRGDRLADIRIDDLGQAGQAWATNVAFGLLGGSGNKAQVRARIAEARAELSLVQKDDAFSTAKIQERIGKLAGTSAVIHVGAPTTIEQAELKLRIEAAIRSARSALQDGVVAGGGAALLGCSAPLGSVHLAGEERVGLDALRHALTEPLRAIVSNAGLDPAPISHRACDGSDLVYDVLSRSWVDPWTTGLVDPLAVVRAALEISVSSAAVALTSEVLVHRKYPPVIMQP
jgi:chaperonin GroEL